MKAILDAELIAALEHLLNAYAELHPEFTAIEVRWFREDESDVALVSMTTPHVAPA